MNCNIVDTTGTDDTRCQWRWRHGYYDQRCYKDAHFVIIPQTTGAAIQSCRRHVGNLLNTKSGQFVVPFTVMKDGAV